MKKVLSLVAMFALAMSLTTVYAQDKPKDGDKKHKTECRSDADKAGCCDKSATKVKKTAMKRGCGVKCTDECTSSTKTSTRKSEAK
jgi:hypothetical protein